MKSVRIRSYSLSHFPTFGLNTDRYSISLRILSECGKIRTRITPNTDTFYAVLVSVIERCPLHRAFSHIGLSFPVLGYSAIASKVFKKLLVGEQEPKDDILEDIMFI